MSIFSSPTISTARLEVEAKVLSTGVTDRKIFRNASGLSEDELDRRFKVLAALKLHPREQIESKTLIARAERLYAEQTPQNRELLRRWIKQFEIEILDQRLREPSSVRSAFSERLDLRWSARPSAISRAEDGGLSPGPNSAWTDLAMNAPYASAAPMPRA